MLIKNATVVTMGGTILGDIAIEGEKIAAIGMNLEGPGPVLDASGLIAMPGGVDVHTHFDLDVGSARSTDDFYTGTVAAACGGTTSIVDHPAFGPEGCALGHQIGVYHELAGGKAVVDYGFHGVVQRVDEGVLADMEDLAAQGITSFKAYMTYEDRLEDGDLYRLLERSKTLGTMLCVHCENHGVLTLLRERFAAEGKTQPRYHPLSRPASCEAEAVNRMLLLSRMAGDAPLYIVHLSTEQGLDYLRLARFNGLRNAWAETCPQYLLLDDSLYDRPDGLKCVLSPPLRHAGDVAALRKGVERGMVDTIATDHCPFDYAGAKQLGKDDFTKCPNGMPGVELRLPLMMDMALSGAFTLTHCALLCSTHPAMLFGLYPQKGALLAGSDADIALFDPSAHDTVSHAMLHENCDYTPYEGQRCRYPVYTISRGEIVAQGGAFSGEAGRGRFLRRGLPQRPEA